MHDILLFKSFVSMSRSFYMARIMSSCSEISVFEKLGYVLLGGGGMLVPQRHNDLCCGTCWGTYCGTRCGNCCGIDYDYCTMSHCCTTCCGCC